MSERRKWAWIIGIGMTFVISNFHTLEFAGDPISDSATIFGVFIGVLISGWIVYQIGMLMRKAGGKIKQAAIGWEI